MAQQQQQQQDGNPPARLPVDRQWLRKLLRRHGRPDEEPALVLAPMVDQSDLPFRLLCRDYGVNLCVTPMVHARLFASNATYRRKFTLEYLPTADRPLIAQICGSDIDMVVFTAKALAPYCDGIDLNCGCPQGIAKRGRYGAFLLEEPDALLPVVRALTATIQIPVSVKVRLLPTVLVSKENVDENVAGDATPEDSPEDAYNCLDDDDAMTTGADAASVPLEFQPSVESSLHLYRQLVDAGVHMLTIHGRTRHQKGHFTGQTDWAAIRQVVEELGDRIPILANGSISCGQDALDCLAETQCDGVMSSEGLLEYPPLLQSVVVRPDGETPFPRRVGRLTLARQYLAYARQYPPQEGGQASGIKCMRVHIHRLCHADLQDTTEEGRRLRDAVVTCQNWEELSSVVDQIQASQDASGHDVASEDLSWYCRYRQRSEDGTMGNFMAGRIEQNKNVKSVELEDDTAECFAGLFGDPDDE